MNLPPPPLHATLEELREYCAQMHRFLQYPTFEVIRFVPRSTAPDTVEGNTYYDSDDDKVKTRDAATWQDHY